MTGGERRRRRPSLQAIRPASLPHLQGTLQLEAIICGPKVSKEAILRGIHAVPLHREGGIGEVDICT